MLSASVLIQTEVELRGFEPLTPCMPSRDPHHDAHQETPRSRLLHQTRRTRAWWFVWSRMATLLCACCASATNPVVQADRIPSPSTEVARS